MKLIKLLILFYTINGFSQLKLNGLVVDESNKPISFASIQLVDKVSNATVTYTQANEKGEFNLKVNSPKKEHYLKLRILGYKPKNVALKNYNNITISLEEDFALLETVIIEADYSEFTVAKDTIDYKLNKITDNTELKLKDIVEKLPGLSIDKNKKIKYQGKKIEKVTIDGHDFFGKKHEMATENISAEAVKGIKLLKNYKDFDDISSEKNGKIVLNITLKKDYRNRIVGNIAGKYGFIKKYQAHTNLFKFIKKGNFALVSEANNIGEPAINMLDYIEMSGGIKNFSKSNRNDGTGAIEIDHSKTPRFVFVNMNIDARKTLFNSLNFTNQFSKKTKLTGYINVDKTTIDELKTNTKTFISDNPITINERNNQNSLSYLGNSYVTFSHKPKENEVLTYNFKFNPLKEETHKQINQNFSLTHIKNNQLINLGQNLSYKKEFNESFYSELNISYDIKNQNGSQVYNANQNFLGLVFIDKIQLKNTEKDKLKNLSINFSNFFKFSEGTTLKSEISYGNKNQEIALVSTKSQFNYNITNRKHQWDLYNKLRYNFNWRLSTEIGLRYNQNTIYINNAETTQNWFLPDVLVSYDLENNKFVNFNYTKKKKNISIYQSNKVALISDYNTILKPNKDIFSPIEKDNFNINYTSYNFTNSSMLSFLANYTIAKNDLSYNTVIKDNYIEQEYTRIKSSSYMFDFSYNSLIKKLKLKYRLNLNFNNKTSYSFMNSVKNLNEIYSYSSRLVLNTNFKRKPINARIHLFYKNSTSKNQFSELDYSINTFYITPEVHGKFNRLFWNLSHRLTKITSNFRNQEINALNFSLQLKLNKRIDLFCKGNNIFNLKNNPLITYNSNQSYRSFIQLERLEGNILIGLRYHF